MAAARSLGDLISRLDEIPTLPSIVYELTQLINNPMSSTHEVEELMSKDQSMTTRVLKLVNSAYYAIPGGVTTLSRAIAYLGFDTVGQLVMTSSIIKTLDVKGSEKFNVSQFWKHSLGVAIACETLAKHVNHPVPNDLFTCGLVHDMGKVAMYTLEPELLLTIVNFAAEKNLSFSEAEDELNAFKHSTIGALLAEKWRLPVTLQAAIKYHHTIAPNHRGSLTANMNHLVDIVVLANLLTQALKFGNSGYEKIVGAPAEILARLRIDPNTGLKAIVLEIKRNMELTADFLRVLSAD